MNSYRYDELMLGVSNLTVEEINKGWHFCCEWDGLLIGPDDEEITVCSCFESEHSLYARKQEFIKHYELALGEYKEVPF